MMLLKSILAFPALLALASAMILDRTAPGEMAILMGTDATVRNTRASVFSSPTSACEKEDEDDCTEFCKASEQQAKCSASGNRVTCSCRGGKSESNCEERCLLCMPDKSVLEEVSRLSKLGSSWKKEL